MTTISANPCVTFAAFGTPEQLQWHANYPHPTPKTGELLIDNHYAGVNPVDCKTRAGLGWGAQQFAKENQTILGFDFAGIVIGGEHPNFPIGSRVCALHFGGGGYARLACIPSALLAPVPENIALNIAGALPCAGSTALQLIEHADIHPGEHIVLNAPAGGVGHLLLQLLACRSVRISVIASAEKYARIQHLAPIEHWIDYQQSSSFPALNADLLLDLVGGAAGSAALHTVRRGGRAICLPSIHVPQLQTQAASMNIDVSGFIVSPRASTLSHLLTEIAEERLSLSIGQTFPLRDAAKAHYAQESGRTFGKIVLDIQGDTTP